MDYRERENHGIVELGRRSLLSFFFFEHPMATYSAALAPIFGVYAALDGVITFVPALRSPERDP